MIGAFLYEIPIPKNTAITAPVKLTLQIPIRRIRRMILMFPNGTKGNVGIRLTNQGLPLVPQAESNVSWVRGDTMVVILKFRADASTKIPALTTDRADARTLEGPANQIECYGYNIDAANDWYVNLQVE